MRQLKSLTLINVLSFFAQVVVFYTVHAQGFNQGIRREIAAPYQSLVIPGGSFSFIVWGVIYTALAIFCLYHTWMAFSHHEKHPSNQDARRVDIFFIINNLGAIGWMITTVNGWVPASLMLLAFQVILLAVIHRQLHIHKRYRRTKSTLCTQGPLSIYAAWLFVLLVGGIGEFFKADGVIWSQAQVGVITFVTLVIIFIRHNILFGLMTIAALFGIVANVDLVVARDVSSISLVTWAGIWVLGLAILVKFVMDFRLRESPVLYHRPA